GVEALRPEAGVALAGPGDAARHHGLDIRPAEPRPTDGLGQDLAHLLLRERGSETQPLAPREQPVEVVLEAEEPPLPHADDVIGQVGPDEPRVQDRDPRLGDRDVLALDPGAPCRESCAHHAPFSPMDNHAVAAIATSTWD